MKRFPEIMENIPDNMTYSFMKNGFKTHINILDCKNFLCSGKISRNSENFPYNTVLFFHEKTAFKHMLIFKLSGKISCDLEKFPEVLEKFLEVLENFPDVF